MSKNVFLRKYVIKKTIGLFFILLLVIYINVKYTNNIVLFIMLTLILRYVISLLIVTSNFKKYLNTIGDEYVTLKLKGLIKFKCVNDFYINGISCIPIDTNTKTISLSNIILSGVYVLNLPSYNIDMNKMEYLNIKKKKIYKKFMRIQLVIYNENLILEQINYVDFYEKKMHTYKYKECIIKFVKVEGYDE